MKVVFKRRIGQILFLLVVSIFAASCSKKNVKQEKILPDSSQTVSDAALTADDGTAGENEGSSRDKDYAPEAGIRTVYFDFDKSELSDETRKVIQWNAATLKKRGVEIQVSGHCDERGTTEYNLALGQRRANVVRNYYKALGIKISRMATISYGEEKPVCTESTDACWAQNRRAETLIRTK
jgi:peptidoglycan-associated lipoprotein